MPSDSLARRALAFEIALREDPIKNKNIHINTCALLTSCDVNTLDRILRIYVEEIDLHRRYARVGQLAGLDLQAPPTPEAIELASSMYKTG